MISSQINFLGSNHFKSSEAEDISSGWHNQGRFYKKLAFKIKQNKNKKLAFELDFERLSDLPDQQFLGPCADGKFTCE